LGKRPIARHARAPFWITGIVLFNFLKSQLPGSMKQFRHFLICRLREIFIEVADRIEIFRRVDTNKVIHFTSEPIAGGKPRDQRGRTSDLVAQRILRFTNIVGRKRVIASTDCGLGGRIHPDIAWAKFEALAQGARVASRKLWGLSAKSA
jgi:hypothetical protein